MYYNLLQFKLTKFINVFFYALVAAITIHISSAEAARDGSLSSSSSASINISVTINQSLKTISPTELLLDRASSKGNSNKPFCVAHHGFDQDASVPYKLVVDEIKPSNNTIDTTADTTADTTLPFDIILEDREIKNSKQKLVDGMSFEKQSRLTINNFLNNKCTTHGLALTIEKNKNNNKKHIPTNSTALLFLLVSPE